MRALILSNRRSERAASLRDEARFAAFVKALALGGIKAVHCLVDSVDELDSCLAAEDPDIVFSASYFVDSSIDMSECLERRCMPFVGSSPEALRLMLSKAGLKDRWRKAGVPTPEYYRASGGGTSVDAALAQAVNFPYIVKPANEGNSRGIDASSVVFSREELRGKAVSLIASYGEVLVERYLGDDPGMREFTVAALGAGRASLFMPAEIRFAGGAEPEGRPRVVTTGDKDSGAARAFPVEEPGLRAELSLLAARACAAAGVRDYARCDIIRSRGSCYAIEINGEPMVPDPWFEACASGAGLGEGRYLIAIFFAALCRLERAGWKGAGWKGADRIPSGAMRVALPRSVYRGLRGDT